MQKDVKVIVRKEWGVRWFKNKFCFNRKEEALGKAAFALFFFKL